MEPTTIRAIAIATAFTLIGAAGTIFVQNAKLPSVPSARAVGGAVKHFDLTIQGADFPMGPNATWHAWTYNGSIPGPTLTATVGDIIEVHVKNTLNDTHSFHSHLSPYELSSDGSQLNTITGIGGMAMIPAGGEYTYEFVANAPGLYYYHDHSADGGHSIQEHMAQGLYGAIIIKAREEPKYHDEVIFMAERGFNVSGSGAPYYIMNGMGMPGGEHHLEMMYAAGGINAVASHFGKDMPIIKGKVGEPVRINVINIGDMVHSFHMHGLTMTDPDTGRPVPAQVLGLVPGESGRFVVTPDHAGVWLFHCHVVSHADGGMIGVFAVDPADSA